MHHFPTQPIVKNVRTISALRRQVSQWRAHGETIGFVPTMGALHKGHERLVQRARKVCDRTIVSVFVNPTQFGAGEDLDNYPRPLRHDLSMCRAWGVDLVFTPDAKAVYPDGFVLSVRVGDLGQKWEGEARPGHFDGVATVVLKLMNMVAPDIAVFGQKDYQQLLIVRRLVRDFNLPVKIQAVPTVRESGGLAVSSRNVYLSPSQRLSATALYRALRWAKSELIGARARGGRIRSGVRKMIEQSGDFSLDYIGLCDRETLEEMRTPRLPLVVLVAATCQTSGPAYQRRFIDNILVP